MLDPGVVLAARERATRPRGLRRLGALVGPGAVVSIAYVDPGNFATNTQAGAEFGTRLLWVVVVASAAAMLLQYLAARLGALTGQSLPELCRSHYPRPVTILLWVQAEVVIAATDLAELLGAAVALQLLFGVPLGVGVVVAALVSLAIVGVRVKERRHFRLAIGCTLGVVLLALLCAGIRCGLSLGDTVRGLRPDGFQSSGSVLLMAGIVGATVMPHAIYLHTDLTHDAPPVAATPVLRWHRRDVVRSLGVAACANLLILLVAAAAFAGTHREAGVDLPGIYRQLASYGDWVAVAFGLALLCSGLAASAVGTNAGDVVMRGFLQRRVPTVVRRSLSLLPGVAIVCLGADPTSALLLSQVVLSLGVPFALVPLLHLGRQAVPTKPGTACTLAAGAVASAICGLNVALVWGTF